MKTPTYTHTHTHARTHTYIHIYIHADLVQCLVEGRKNTPKIAVSFKPMWNTRGFKTGIYDRKQRPTTEPSLSVLCKTKLYMYTGCPRRNVRDFGRVFLMLKNTDITQNTYVQRWTVTEIMAREECGLLAGPRTEPVSWRSYPYPSLSVVSYYGNSAHARSKLLMYFLLGDKVVHVSAWHSCHV